MRDYDRAGMGPQHPIDAEIRARLLALFTTGAITPAEFARRTGTKQPWLHRYVRGEGHATIDEVIRIAAVASGVLATSITEPGLDEIVRLWRSLTSEDDRDDVLEYVRLRLRLQRSKESSAPAARTPPAATSTARGRRKAAAE